MRTSRHYRATVAQAEAAALTHPKAYTTAKLRSANAIKQWLLTVGPVYLRFRWYSGSTVDARLGGLTLKGTKGAREAIALVAYNESPTLKGTSELAVARAKAQPFRAITTRGSAFGQAGRVWLSAAALAKIVKDGGTVIGVKL